MPFLFYLSEGAVVDWFHHCRCTFAKTHELEPKFVGTDECTIEVDEACIAGKAKYKKDRRLSSNASDIDEEETEIVEPDNDDEMQPGDSEFERFGENDPTWRWVVSVYNGPEKVRYVRVPNRTTNTLLPIIAKYCAAKSVVHTYGWGGYAALSQHGFVHRTVIHEHNYVDPLTGAQTQVVERQWVELRSWWRLLGGNKAMLQSHLEELSSCALHKSKLHSMVLFDQFLADVKLVHGLQH